MKQFTFELHVTVYADTEDEAKEAFCDDPVAWDIDEDDLICIHVEDLNIEVEPPSETS